jgi:hypothetical protein
VRYAVGLNLAQDESQYGELPPDETLFMLGAICSNTDQEELMAAGMAGRCSPA